MFQLQSTTLRNSAPQLMSTSSFAPGIRLTPRMSNVPQVSSFAPGPTQLANSHGHPHSKSLTPMTLQQRSASFSPPPVCDALGDLTLPLSAGDVICAKGGADGITRLGATGGFMGHVLLVVSPPVGIQRNSVDAIEYQNMWPRDTRTLWIVRAGESCRSAEGFQETDLIMCVNKKGQLLIIGEVARNQNGLIQYDKPTKAQLFCCPPDLRAYCRSDMMNEVLAQLRDREASWSWGTAVRAFLFSADVAEDKDSDDMLEEIKYCWRSDPICTSIIIIFWQQYMCKLADYHEDVHAMDWILQWMPVKADRALPGELLSTMHKCGWTVIDSIDEGKNRASSF